MCLCAQRDIAIGDSVTGHRSPGQRTPIERSYTTLQSHATAEDAGLSKNEGNGLEVTDSRTMERYRWVTGKTQAGTPFDAASGQGGQQARDIISGAGTACRGLPDVSERRSRRFPGRPRDAHSLTVAARMAPSDSRGG